MVVHGYTSLVAGRPRGLEGPRENTKSRACHIDCVRRFLGACPQINFEILHSLKFVLGASYSKAFFFTLVSLQYETLHSCTRPCIAQ